MSHRSLLVAQPCALRPLALSLLLVGLNSWAADPAPATPAAPAAAPARNELDKVEVIGAGAVTERRQSTAAKIVVSKEEIREYGDQAVTDVLKRLPGVTIGGAPGRGGGIRMRGLGNGYTQILINGDPLPPGFSIDDLTPDMIERIEVVRSATAEHSTQAVAGTINIVLNRSISTTVRDLKVALGSERGGPNANVSTTLSDKSGALSYSLSGNLTLTRSERPNQSEQISRANGVVVRDWVSAETNKGSFAAVNLAPRLTWNLGSGDSLTSESFIHATRYRGSNANLTVAAVGTPPLYGLNNWDWASDMTMLRSQLEGTKKFADNAKLTGKLAVNANERQTDYRGLAYSPSGPLGLDRRVVASGRDNGLTASGKFSQPTVTGHAVVLGWDGALSRRAEGRTQTDRTYNGVTPINSVTDYSAEVRRLALFAQDEWDVTPAWSVYLGLRWEGLDTRSTATGVDAVRNRSNVVSPILQTLYRIPDSKNDQVRLAFARTYKAPNTGDLIPRRFLALENSPSSPDYMGNPALRPELSWGIDAAYEHYWGTGNLLSASVYSRRVENLIRRLITQDATGWVSMPFNAGNAWVRGVELDSKFRLNSVINDAPDVNLRANLALNLSTVDTVPGPNNRLDQQTPASANFGFDYTAKGWPLTVGGNVTFTAGGPVRASAQQFIYTTTNRGVDVYALWKFTRRTQLRLSASNMLHQTYMAQSSYVDAGTTFDRFDWAPTKVNLRAMLEVRF